MGSRIVIVTFAELGRISRLADACDGFDLFGERRFDEARYREGLEEILGAGLVEEMYRNGRAGVENRLVVGEMLFG
jgi:hypothetical protein